MHGWIIGENDARAHPNATVYYFFICSIIKNWAGSAERLHCVWHVPVLCKEVISEHQLTTRKLNMYMIWYDREHMTRMEHFQ